MPGYWRTQDDAYGERRDRRSGPDRPERHERHERQRPEPSEEIQLELARELMLRIAAEVDLDTYADRPDFGSVVPDLEQPVLPPDAITDPWMDPHDADGAETARRWKWLGYAVDVPEYRLQYARNLGYLLRQQLVSAKLESSESTPDATVHQVRTGLIGENGRHAILVTRWLVRPTGRPELIAAWPEPSRELPATSSSESSNR